MNSASTKLLDQALTLPEDERLEIATEILASVDGPADADWDATWLKELQLREQAALARGVPAPEWSAVRARILAKLYASK